MTKTSSSREVAVISDRPRLPTTCLTDPFAPTSLLRRPGHVSGTVRESHNPTAERVPAKPEPNALPPGPDLELPCRCRNPPSSAMSPGTSIEFVFFPAAHWTDQPGDLSDLATRSSWPLRWHLAESHRRRALQLFCSTMRPRRSASGPSPTIRARSPGLPRPGRTDTEAHRALRRGQGTASGPLQTLSACSIRNPVPDPVRGQVIRPHEMRTHGSPPSTITMLSAA